MGTIGGRGRIFPVVGMKSNVIAKPTSTKCDRQLPHPVKALAKRDRSLLPLSEKPIPPLDANMPHPLNDKPHLSYSGYNDGE